MDAYEDTEINWRVRRGYGALMAAYGAPCPLALNTQVTLIDHSGKARADRDLAGHAFRRQGDRHRADQSDRRRGDPLSPGAAGESRRRARPAARARRQGDAGAGASRRRCRRTAICAAPPCAPRWAAFICARSASPASKAFSADALRAQLEDAGDGALAAQAIDEIVALLGSDFRRRLKPLAESRWAHDPFARGSYSHALPGHAGKRAVLAAPGRRPSVLCRRSHLAELFLDRARGEGQRGAGGGRGGGGARAMS